MADRKLSGRGPSILTFSGKGFYFLDPRPEEVLVEDIAHSLSLQCRFNGHCGVFYSVAEHSVLVSRYLMDNGGDAKLGMIGLLHDAAEAYIGDIVSPLKPLLPKFIKIEKSIEKCIASTFDIVFPFPKEVHKADKAILAMEFKFLSPFCSPGKATKRLSPTAAEGLFLESYRDLRTLISCGLHDDEK